MDKFNTFHPYRSYNSEEYSFLDANGNEVFQEILANETVSNDIKKDFWTLWLLGRNAYKSFEKFENQDNFDLAYSDFLMMVSLIRDITKNCGHPRNGKDGVDLLSSEIIDLIWNTDAENTFSKEQWGALMMFSCLESIEAAFLKLANGGGAIENALLALNSFNIFQSLEHGTKRKSLAFIENGKKARSARVDLIPKEEAKKEVKKLWDEWQKDRRKYKSQMAFAIAAEQQAACDANEKKLVTVNTIVKNWIPEWAGRKKKT